MSLSLTRSTVIRDDVELAVFVGGNPQGPTLVMVHGWPDTHLMWHSVAEQLASRFRVVMYDTRGQGESALPEEVHRQVSFALPDLAQDFFAVIDDVSPTEPVHVLAHDWGSIQVWEAVCEDGAEQRVASFTSMSGPNLDHLGMWVRRNLSRPTPRKLLQTVAQGVSSSYVPFFVSPLAGPVLRTVATRDRWRRVVSSTEGCEPEPDAHAPTLVQDMVNGLSYYRANTLNLGTRPRERRTTVPVLQLVLTRDGAIRPDSLRESERWTERLERVELPYGHWAALTHPDVIARETASFIDSTQPATAG
ncbi:MAG: alpha/beta hydrolase [Nocardioides sp.]|jgi:pimeloyl-ACP methyl ester carboxylesterase|uniref:alpha/beta fold hydrolase n=1 Tax=Nocardioides sp. TaxID=35761 RepID=UPI0026246CE3|nr:alpha/beta fold hydrolase [Nocardioides sp.]MCW2833321.1 alpha/beta hydrolase [Nocardioides sp.]